MSRFKKCPNGHYYQGDTCPYCPTQSWGYQEPKHDPTIDYRNHFELLAIPICPRCGQPVRKGISRPKNGFVSSMHDIQDHLVPWNYLWDGHCEYCECDFSFETRIDMGSFGPDNGFRITKVKMGNRAFLHDITCNMDNWRATVLSGIEIETGGERLFLSANEVKLLMKILKDSPLLKQFDYYEGSV